MECKEDDQKVVLTFLREVCRLEDSSSAGDSCSDESAMSARRRGTCRVINKSEQAVQGFATGGLLYQNICRKACSAIQKKYLASCVRSATPMSPPRGHTYLSPPRGHTSTTVMVRSMRHPLSLLHLIHMRYTHTCSTT